MGDVYDSKSLVLTSSNVAAPAVATSAYHHHHNHHHYNNGGPYATGAGYGTGTSSFYGAAAAASAGGYYPLSSSLKTGGTYPLAPYFGSATTPPAYYGSTYPSSGTLDYSTYNAAYSQYYASPNCYYGSTTSAPTTAAVAAAAAYQLTQLPTTAAYPSSDITTTTTADSLLSLPFGNSCTKSSSEPRKSKSNKKKKTQQSTPTSPENQFERVFLWELDDVCVLSSRALATGLYAQNYKKDHHIGAHLAHAIEIFVANIIQVAFEIDETEECDQVHIDDVTLATSSTPDDTVSELSYNDVTLQLNNNNASSSASTCHNQVRGGVDWMRKLAIRYRKIREVYSQFNGKIHDLLRVENTSQWTQLLIELDQFSERWTQRAKLCLQLIARTSATAVGPERYANVLISSNTLVHTFAALMLFNLNGVFSIDNVYSSMKCGRDACLDRIVNRFGKKCSFVVVGCSSEIEAIAKKENIPFWSVRGHPDLDLFYIALNQYLLG